MNKHGGHICFVAPLSTFGVAALVRAFPMPGAKRPMETLGARILFIDIDGVLNRGLSGRVEPRFVAMLARVVRETCATLVMSTAWRLKREDRAAVVGAFLEQGVATPLSCTPYIDDPKHHRNARGNEVLAWLQLNTTNVFQEEAIEYGEFVNVEDEFDARDYTLPVRMRVTQFAILDDRDMRRLKHGGHHRALLAPHFVHTRTLEGVTREEMAQVTRILQSDGAPCGRECEHCGGENETHLGAGGAFCSLSCRDYAGSAGSFGANKK